MYGFTILLVRVASGVCTEPIIAHLEVGSGQLGRVGWSPSPVPANHSLTATTCHSSSPLYLHPAH